MNIRYSRLSTGEFTNVDWLKLAKSRLPLVFIKQQIVLVSIVVASFLLLIFTTLFTSDADYELLHDFSSEDNFGVIVDCGSSGSRAHVFKWRQPDVRIELVRDRTSKKPINIHITPGLSSVKDDPDRASDYMEPIMKFISETIPRDKHLETPVHFLGTAGLRLLDDRTQRRILTDITRDLRAKFDFPKIKSQVITGEFEGIYSWLSLNMKKKLYNFHKSSDSSYGMIEMGGASTQVTFELDPMIENEILKNLKSTDAISAFKSEQVSLSLGPASTVKLFATTFLGLGVNSAREATIDLLVRDYLVGSGVVGVKPADLSKFEVRLHDPCLTIGSSEIVQRPATLLGNSNQTIGLTLGLNDENFKVRLEGAGDFLTCMSLCERMLQTVKTERLNCHPSKHSCPMALLGTEFIPYSHHPFIGLSEMFFTTNEMMSSSGLFNRSKVLHETQRICSTQYNKLLELYLNNGVSFEDRILYECFKASWLLTILHSSGFKMPNEYENFRTLDQLDGEEIDWTRGAMVSEIALKGRSSSE